MKQLIVAADDLGLTKSVNEGIVKACREGIVTSVNLLPTGEAFDDALRLAEDTGLKEAGAHLAITETSPMSDRAKIPSLVGKDGRFHKNYAQLFLKPKIDARQVYGEFKKQLEAVIATGIGITNLSGHEHIHMLPAILDMFISLAKEYGIPAIRCIGDDRLSGAIDVKKVYKRFILSSLGARLEKKLDERGIKHTDHFRGFLNSGDLNENTILDLLDNLEEGTTELVCHPGFLGPEVLERYRFHVNCEAELFALTSRRVKKLADERGIRLISYAEFLADK